MLRTILPVSLLHLGFLLGCGACGPSRPAAGPVARREVPAETYRPRAPHQLGSAMIYLAGSTVQRLVNFQVVEGIAVLDGDIVLGPANLVPFRFGAPNTFLGGNGATRSAVARSGRADLWPRAEIPYEIDPAVPAEKVGWINWSVQQINQTALRMRPATSADQDRVVFREGGDGCHSHLGRTGGAQEIQMAGCTVQGSVAHEILHAAGFYHEQSRGDRDQFIAINWNDIDPANRYNFEIRDQGGADIGAYDYGSIMHYPARAFSTTGQPTIVPRAQGVTIGQREGLSALDRAAIQQLYGNGANLPSPGSAPGGLPFPFPAALPGGLQLPWGAPGAAPAPNGPSPAPSQPGFLPGLPPIPGLPAGQGLPSGQGLPTPRLPW